jgi:ribosomal protein S17E
MIKNMIKGYLANLNDKDVKELKNMIKDYVANLNDKNYKKLKEEAAQVIEIEDKKRGIK